MTQTHAEVFARMAQAYLDETPGLGAKLQLELENRVATLSIPGSGRFGFAVTLTVGQGEWSFETDRGLHDDFQLEEPVEPAFAQLLGWLRDMLSDQMRVRELRSNDRPYEWILESWDGSGWSGESRMRLIFYNYFGRRTEAIFQNCAVVGRPADLPGHAHHLE